MKFSSSTRRRTVPDESSNKSGIILFYVLSYISVIFVFVYVLVSCCQLIFCMVLKMSTLKTVAAVSATSLLTSFVFYIWNYSYWLRLRVKQSFPFPIFGDNFKHFFKRIPYHQFLSSLYMRFPTENYIGFYQYLQPGLMLRDPTLIKQICVTDQKNFIDRLPFLEYSDDELWKNTVFALRGEKWEKVRNALSPAFTAARMRQIFTTVDNYGRNFNQTLAVQEGQVIDVELKDLFTRFTTDIIASVAFGHDVNSWVDRDNEFYKKVEGAMLSANFWKTFKLNLTLLCPRFGKILNTRIFEEPEKEFFTQLISDTIQYRIENGIIRPDMLQLLMQIMGLEQQNQPNNGGQVNFDVNDVTSQAMIFFLGGFETMSTALCFMSYELALNKNIQDKLFAEIVNYINDSGALTYDGVAKLDYMQTVLYETLRKWPPLLNLDRIAADSYEIKSSDPNKRSVYLQKGTLVWIPVYGLHHDPRFWNDPEKFNPDRFNKDNREKINKGAYLPFGLGRRNCLGLRFASMVIKMVMFEILRNFEIVRTNKSVVPFIPVKQGYNLASEGGFKFGLKKRIMKKNPEEAGTSQD